MFIKMICPKICSKISQVWPKWRIPNYVNILYKVWPSRWIFLSIFQLFFSEPSLVSRKKLAGRNRKRSKTFCSKRTTRNGADQHHHPKVEGLADIWVLAKISTGIKLKSLKFRILFCLGWLEHPWFFLIFLKIPKFV